MRSNEAIYTRRRTPFISLTNDVTQHVQQRFPILPATDGVGGNTKNAGNSRGYRITCIVCHLSVDSKIRTLVTLSKHF